MGSMQCNVEFGYQLSICSGTKENHGNAVYYENHTEHTDTFRTSQETNYISNTEPN
jgi:hypothetical protein